MGDPSLALVVLIAIPALVAMADLLPPACWLARALDSLSDSCGAEGEGPRDGKG